MIASKNNIKISLRERMLHGLSVTLQQYWSLHYILIIDPSLEVSHEHTIILVTSFREVEKECERTVG